jgi:long-chain fatty acid transport protein
MQAESISALPGNIMKKDKTMKNKTILYIAVIFGVVICWSSVFASGYTDTYGIGNRAISLGGAFTAVADDFSAAYYNPAGLAQSKDLGLSIEYLFTSPSIEVDKLSGGSLIIYNNPNNIDSGIRNDPTQATAANGMNLGIPVIGLMIDINKIFKLPVHTQLGIAAALPESADVSYRIHDYPPDQPHFIRYGDDINRITLAVGLGIEAVKDIFYIGGGVQAMLHGPGKFAINGLDSDLHNEYQDVEAQSEFGAVFDYVPTFGLLLASPVLEKTTMAKVKLGFSWRDQQELQLGPIPVSTWIDAGGLIINQPMMLDMNCFFTPEEYSLGLALDTEPVLVSLEANLQKWSKYSLSYTDSVNGYEDPGFNDTTNYRIGVSYKGIKNLNINAGYMYQPSPVPNQSGKVSNYIDLDKNIFSLGAGYKFKFPWDVFKQPLKVEGVLQYQKLKEITVIKDGVTGQSWVDQVSYDVKGTSFAAGLNLNLTW